MTSQMELGFFSMIFWEMIQLQNESLSNSFPQNQSSQLVPVGPDGTVQPRWSPGDGEAFEGPCWETLDTAVELIEASGLQLLLVRLFWVEL